MIERWKCVGYCRHHTEDDDESTFSKEWGHFEKRDDGPWVRADSAVALNAEVERLHGIIHNALWSLESDDNPTAVILRRAIPKGMGYFQDRSGKTRLIRGPSSRAEPEV